MNSRQPEPNSTRLIARPKVREPLGAWIRTSCGNSFALRDGSCLVGSGSECQLVLPDASVSREHVQLKLDPFGVRVTDLGSTNGTFYLGQRIGEAVLGFGSQIRLGETTLFLSADTPGVNSIEPFAHDEYRGLIGASLPMRQLFGLLQRLEGSLATVLVEGESGVGKELVALALHEGSAVSAGNFVPVNCGALPRELVASELFGHKRGAFSGAIEARPGAFETANGGTLFLDEIGELPLEVQPILLRALETGEVRPVGEDRARRVQVRVVAATNRDLAKSVAKGEFREDLYFRLAVVRLTIPPLHERKEDLEPLARRFAAARGLGELPSEVIEDLRGRTYPGNVRELRNAVDAYAALKFLPSQAAPTKGSSTMADEFRSRLNFDQPYLAQRDEIVDAFTRVYLEALLERTAGNQSAAARLAGLDRTYLAKLIARSSMRPSDK